MAGMVTEVHTLAGLCNGEVTFRKIGRRDVSSNDMAQRLGAASGCDVDHMNIKVSTHKIPVIVL